MARGHERDIGGISLGARQDEDRRGAERRLSPRAELGVEQLQRARVDRPVSRPVVRIVCLASAVSDAAAAPRPDDVARP